MAGRHAASSSLLDELDALLPDSTVPAASQGVMEGGSPRISPPAAAGGLYAAGHPQDSVEASQAVLTSELTETTGHTDVVSNAPLSSPPAAPKGPPALHATHSAGVLAAVAIPPPMPSGVSQVGGVDSSGAVASNKDTPYQPSSATVPPVHRLARPSSPAEQQSPQGQDELDRGPESPPNQVLPQGKQLPSTFSFQDIMQGRPSSSGRMPGRGRPPLPRMPGAPALGMQPRACAACEHKEQQVADLSAQLQNSADEVASMRRELVELDGHCEALEQLVGDREAQVLEIEGIAADQAAKIGKLLAGQEAAEAFHRSAVAQLQEDVARLEAQTQSAADGKAAAVAAAAAADDASACLTAELLAKVANLEKENVALQNAASTAEEGARVAQNKLCAEEEALSTAEAKLAHVTAEMEASAAQAHALQGAAMLAQADEKTRHNHLSAWQHELTALQSKIEVRAASVAAGQHRLEQERARVCQELARLGSERRLAVVSSERDFVLRIQGAQQACKDHRI